MSGRSAAPIDVALRFLATRPRSEREVRLRLQRAQVSEADVESVLSRLREDGLVDDAAFAAYWIEQRQTFRPRGRRLLRAELKQFGVAADVVDDATEPANASAEDDAYRVAHKYGQRVKALDERAFKSRLAQMLARRGFDWDVVAPVVARLYSEVHRTGSERRPRSVI